MNDKDQSFQDQLLARIDEQTAAMRDLTRAITMLVDSMVDDDDGYEAAPTNVFLSGPR